LKAEPTHFSGGFIMATQLYAVANLTAQYATLTSTEDSKDTVVLDPGSVVHTGGADGDYCKIPDCSERKYFQAHHMSIKGGTLDIALWNDDEQNHQLYYSPDGTFDKGVPVPESQYWEGVSILIDSDFKVTFFPY
jgi:hypothetical protein